MLPHSVSGVVPIEAMQGEDQADTELLRTSLDVAQSFLLSQKWCFGLGDIYFGDGIGGIVSIFLMEIDPVFVGIDQWLWVIVGDLPPVYLVIDQSPTPIEALRAYIAEMRRWVALAHENKASPDVIPVNKPATSKYAELLESKLNALEEIVIPQLEAGKAE